MNVLIVGCGAVGQVYGLALQNAGVTLGFLAQPATAEKLVQAREKGGLLLFQVTNNRKSDLIPYRIKDYQVITNTEDSL
jgi:ketopantoate reductase